MSANARRPAQDLLPSSGLSPEPALHVRLLFRGDDLLTRGARAGLPALCARFGAECFEEERGKAEAGEEDGAAFYLPIFSVNGLEFDRGVWDPEWIAAVLGYARDFGPLALTGEKLADLRRAFRPSPRAIWAESFRLTDWIVVVSVASVLSALAAALRGRESGLAAADLSLMGLFFIGITFAGLEIVRAVQAHPKAGWAEIGVWPLLAGIAGLTGWFLFCFGVFAPTRVLLAFPLSLLGVVSALRQVDRDLAPVIFFQAVVSNLVTLGLVLAWLLRGVA